MGCSMMKHPWTFWTALAVVETFVIAALAIAVNVATGGVFSIAVGLVLLGAMILNALLYVLKQYLTAASQPNSESESNAAPDPLLLLKCLAERSAVRVRERLESMQLSSSVVDELELLLDQLLPPVDLPADPVVLVTGDLGSGKSTLAETLHRRSIASAQIDLSEPWPVFVDARRLDATDLEPAVRTEAPLAVRAFVVVLDGLDEIDRAAAAQLVGDARRLVHTYPGSKVLLFSRPGYIEWTKPVEIPRLSDEQADLILRTVAERNLRWHSVPKALQGELSKPMFAILTARYYGSHTDTVTTPFGLLGLMVEDILARENQLPAEDLSRALRELACRTTLNGGRVREAEAGPLEARLALVSTRLVVRHDGYFRFASAIIEQYFAGQALLRREVDVAEQLSSLRRWEPWRSAWLMAIAVGGWQGSADLMAALVAAHPGAASWVVHQAVSLFERSSPIDDDGAPSAAADDILAGRLRQAVSGWAQAVPIAFAPWGIGPAAQEGTSLAISVSGVMTSFEAVHVSVGGSSSSSGPRLGRRISDAPNWPWRMGLDLGQRSLADHMRKIRWNPSVPALAHEEYFDVFSEFVPAGFGPEEYAVYRSMPRPDYVRRKIDHLLELAAEHGADRIGTGGHHHSRSYRPDELRRLIDLLETTEGNTLASSPWPEPDAPPADEVFWRNYSAARIRSRVVAVYLAALDGYREIADRSFPELRSTMSLAALMPLNLVGELSVMNEVAALKYHFAPLEVERGNAVNIHVAPSPTDEADFAGWSREQGNLVARLRGESASWINVVQTWSRLSVEGRMPATRIAVGWLWRDLNALHLVEGNAPAD
jgi:hypothetical protein